MKESRAGGEEPAPSQDEEGGQAASYRGGWVSLPPPYFSLLLAIIFLISLIMGYFLCRSPISVDLLLKPPPTVASGEAETPTLDLLCSKRVRREDVSGDLGCTEEERHAPQLEAIEGGGRMEELVHPEAPTSVATCPATAAEARLVRAGKAILMEVSMPPPAIGEATVGEVTAADASSDLISQEDAREVTVKAMKEAPVRVGALEPSEPAAWASSSPKPTPSARTVMPTFGKGIGVTAGPLLFGAAFDSEKVPQGPLTALVVGSDRGEASPAPKAATKDALGEKVPAATAGLALGVKALPTNFSMNGQILPPAPRLVETSRPRVTA
jgi:hypothetical protein